MIWLVLIPACFAFGWWLSRSVFDGSWRTVYRCRACHHVDDFNWSVCPKCGEQHPDYDRLVGRPSGLNGWEVKTEASAP
jgi:hypothetical protein